MTAPARSAPQVRQPQPDPYRKARFREEAREIVWKDRADRKRGLVTDTGGAIARALERAYRQGYVDAQAEPAPSPPAAPDAGVDWTLIPPRPRSAFWSCCLSMVGWQGKAGRGAELVACETERGTPGWILMTPGISDEKAFGGKTIAPLIRLGLFEPDPQKPKILVLTESGKVTWRRFEERGGKYPDDLPGL
jgi:hypothetical protein